MYRIRPIRSEEEYKAACARILRADGLGSGDASGRRARRAGRLSSRYTRTSITRLGCPILSLPSSSEWTRLT